jgi:anti-anti-sigma factor
MNRTLEDLQVLIRAGAAGSGVRICVGGQLDLATTGVLRKALDRALQAGFGDVEVELSEVTFCDSTGLRLLLAAHHTLRAMGRTLSLLNPAPPVVRLLEVSATRDVFDVRTCAQRAAGQPRRRVSQLMEPVTEEAASRRLDAASEQLYDELLARIAAITEIVPGVYAKMRPPTIHAELAAVASRTVTSLWSSHDPDATDCLIRVLWPTNTAPHASHAWWSTPLGRILADRPRTRTGVVARG